MGIQVDKSMSDEMLEWMEQLRLYVSGEKQWDTGCVWVCESHPLMPVDMGYSFDCTCGSPGMQPILPGSKRR